MGSYLPITMSLIDSISEIGFSGKVGVLWSGGKNSSVLWDIVSREMDCTPVFIDHGLHPQETHELMHRMFRKGNFQVDIIRNDRVLGNIREGKVYLSDGAHDYTMSDPLVYRELYVNPLIEATKKYSILFAGNRWSRRPEDSYLKYFERNGSSLIVRPILHWTESEVWEYILKNRVDVNERYSKGWRIVDYAYDGKLSDVRAWDQKLDDGHEESISEKKADLIRKLKDLGYL